MTVAQRIFTGIAPIYDRMNRLLSLGLDTRWRRIAAASASGNPRRILDLACGTGDFAAVLAERFPDAEITGVDITPAMLKIARGKCRSPRIRFVEGDAASAPSALAADGPFSLCTCAFGFRNFSDRRTVLRETRRALVPGGELVVLEFFRYGNSAMRILVSLWLSLVSALFARGALSSYRYLRESVRAMSSAGEFAALAGEEGFRLAERKTLLPCCTLLRFAAE